MIKQIKDTRREIAYLSSELASSIDGYQRELIGLKEKINLLKDLHERLNDQETINENN